ncbi:3-methyladenine DNA glycosylase [Zhihengliuella sp.]|uniref:DNA-3-methyladenine glycosylase family protein n=1 Tax=Zhihengliuella sp. TaxID=1954483 RepID=UPI002810E6FD|nr:3-methyladenine DNA glycosylase [Zhihengliuella sp.]
MTEAPALPLARPDAEGDWRPGRAYALRPTLGILQRGTMDPCVRVGERTAWMCFRTTAGPVSLLIQHLAEPGGDGRLPTGQHDAGRVRWRAWGEGAAGLAAEPERVERLLGSEDDWSGLDDPDVAATLPHALCEARRRNPGLRLPATGRVFDALVPVVLEQKVTTIEARYAWRYLVRRFGDAAPAPRTASLPEGLRLPLTAEQIRRVPSWEWHAARVDATRSRALMLAAESADGLDRLGSRPIVDHAGHNAVSRAMQSIPGIGPWSVAETLQRSHGAPDTVSVGDFHLAAYVGAALTGRRTDDAGMLRLLEPWRGHRQRVVRLIQATGFRKPTYGPRLSPMDHRRH